MTETVIEKIWRWCQGKAEATLPRRPESLESLKDQDDLLYDAGYRRGYRDCAEFVGDWIEESGEVDE